MFRPRRKLSISTEALFVIDLPKIKHKISFFLNRLEHLVTMDISSSSLTVSKSFLLPYNNDSSTIRSLAIAFHGKQISLYIECNEVSVHSVEKGLSQLYLQSDTPSIKLVRKLFLKWKSVFINIKSQFRERKYPLYFDGSIDDALSRANCHKVNRKNGNKKLLRNKTHNKGKTSYWNSFHFYVFIFRFFLERNKRQDNKRRLKVSELHLKHSDSESSKPNQILNGKKFILFEWHDGAEN